MTLDIWVVIVNWNLRDDTLACIASLHKSGFSINRIVLVDNGSQDGSIAAFRSLYGDTLAIIENLKNLGYVPALNQGIKYALNNKASWVMLLNNDTCVASDFFDELSKGMVLHYSYDIYAPLIFYYSKPRRIWYLGDRLIPNTLITINPFRGKEYNSGLANVIPVDFVSGCAMIVRRDVFERIGLFDPFLTMYGEEIDFCWRARNAGFRFACITKAWMWHKVSASASKMKPYTRYLRTRNQMLFYRKNAKFIQLLFMFVFSIAKITWNAFIDLKSNQIELIPPLLRGWREGWFGKWTGERN